MQAAKPDVGIILTGLSIPSFRIRLKHPSAPSAERQIMQGRHGFAENFFTLASPSFPPNLDYTGPVSSLQ
jgi:hypothetical protein